MNFVKRFLASSPKEVMVTIPSGELYLKRTPNSPKGVKECIFKDAQAIIRRTSTDYHYQLVVQRVYEEGEEGLEGDGEDSELEEENKDEWTFLIDEALQISYTSRGDNVVIVWRDTSDDPEDVFEFLCAESVKPSTFDEFDVTARKCQYERKYQKPFAGSDSDLDEFDFDPPEVAEEPLSESVATLQPEDGDEDQESRSDKQDDDEPQLEAPAPQQETEQQEPPKTPERQKSAASKKPPKHSEIPPVEGSVMCSKPAQLHLFDSPTETFIKQADECVAKVYDLGGFKYWLEVEANGKRYLGLQMDSSVNPCFNYENLAFIFNYMTGTAAFSWLLKFETFEVLEQFQQGVMQALWEQSNRKKWVEAQQDYVMDQFENMDLDDAEMAEYEEEEEEEGEGEDPPRRRPQDEDYDTDEEHDELETFDGKGKNSQLAVGMSKDRSYVVRGNKIGVFKQTADNNLDFSTTIDNVSNMQGKSFSPTKVMLHTQDSSLVLQDPDDPKKLYNMDLEYGKVVDEWGVGGRELKAYGPSEKFSQATGEKTLVGISDRGLFRVDPRLSTQSKLVDSEQKSYSTKTGFESMATNQAGNIAVASTNGDIRLYDRLGINAKTHIPALGDKINALDTSADGKWILATCDTYLLLIDATIKDGKNTGSTGFQKSFAKDSKPRPKRLQIKPEHVAFMQENGSQLKFTPAHFNAGFESKEQTIVTSSGPYVITWSMKKLLRGDKEPYLIKRYEGQVMADNFKFGTDKNVIIALEDDVGMVNRSTFRKPTRESLATPARRVQAMSRNSIVNSPF